MGHHQVCGYGAECINLSGSHQCVCPHGYGGDPYNGLCSPAQKRCTSDNECKANEKCVQPGECVCPPPFYTDALDGNLCKSEFTRYNNNKPTRKVIYYIIYCVLHFLFLYANYKYFTYYRPM